MANPINRFSFSNDLYPAGVIWFGDKQKELEPIYDKIFKTHAMPDGVAIEKFVKNSGLGLPSRVDEGQNFRYDDMAERWAKYTKVDKYVQGFIVTSEAIEDGKSKQIMKLKAPELARVMHEQKELLAASYLDLGFTDTTTGGDGSALFVSTHPTRGGTFSNVPAAPVALSEAGLEQNCKDIWNMKNERGMRISVNPRKLIIHPNNSFELKRILGADGQVYTPDNTPNALRAMGMFSEGAIQNQYLGNTNCYYILTDQAQDEGLLYLSKKEPTLESDNVFDNDMIKFKSTMRCAFIHVDYMCIYGVSVA